MNKENFDIVNQALQKAMKAKKVPANKLGLLLVQAAHESAGFNPKKSNLVKHNNYTGIKFVKQNGAYNSLVISPEGNYYAGYLTPDLWAKNFIEILSRKRNDNPVAPIEATSITKFAEALKRNGYYTDSVTNYINGLETWAKSLKNIASKIPFPVPTKIQGTLFMLVAIILLFTFLNQK